MENSTIVSSEYIDFLQNQFLPGATSYIKSALSVLPEESITELIG